MSTSVRYPPLIKGPHAVNVASTPLLSSCRAGNAARHACLGRHRVQVGVGSTRIRCLVARALAWTLWMVYLSWFDSATLNSPLSSFGSPDLSGPRRVARVLDLGEWPVSTADAPRRAGRAHTTRHLPLLLPLERAGVRGASGQIFTGRGCGPVARARSPVPRTIRERLLRLWIR